MLEVTDEAVDAAYRVLWPDGVIHRRNVPRIKAEIREALRAAHHFMERRPEVAHLDTQPHRLPRVKPLAEVIEKWFFDHYGLRMAFEDAASLAKAIRESDEAAGMVLVPREATEKMALAGCLSLPHNEQTLLRWQRDPAAKDLELDDMDASWRAMIAAATEADNDPR